MQRLTKTLYIITTLLFFPVLLFLSTKESLQLEFVEFQHSSDAAAKYSGPAVVNNEIIRIASVICSKPGNNAPREKAATLIKSAIISTILYNISNRIEFHLFLENESDETYFSSKLTEFGSLLTSAQITLYFHSAINGVPKKYRSKLSYDKRFRCMYVRIFFPSTLPDVDAVLYLDIDALITGNLLDVWSYFSKMNSEQLVGIAPDLDAKSHAKPYFVKGIPYPAPKGLNSGVLLMNLTRMRNYLWDKKLLRLYEDYGMRMHVKLNDQMLLNVLIYFDSGILLQLPCHYNYWLTHCFSRLYCHEAAEDPNGIQVIHGAAHGFNRNQAFAEIYTAYRDFPLRNTSSVKVIKEKLMTPIRKQYSNLRTKNGKRKKYRGHHGCDTAIGKLLFKRFIN